MRTYALLAMMGLIAAAETPKTQPAPTPPKVATLSETDQLRVENIQLRLQLATADLNKELNAIFDKACKALGGASPEDCTPSGPNRDQPKAPYAVTLKPAASAKAEEPKK